MEKREKEKRENGFSFIEVLIGMALVVIALLGLAQLFTLSVLQNLRSSEISNATFLAQQQVEYIRTLTSAELSALTAAPIDELIDPNQDGTLDFRRITRLQVSGLSWELKVLVFPPTQLTTSQNELFENPAGHQVKAQVSTLISR